MTRLLRRVAMAAALLPMLMSPGVAIAHPGHDAGGGLVAGLAHPLSGADHLVAMMLAGVCAGAVGGRVARLLPAMLLAAMLAGFEAGPLVPVAVAEGLVTATLVGLAMAALLHRRLAPALVVLVIAFAGLAHGFAHGLEAPGTARTGFVIGFLTSAAMLQVAGLGLARLFAVCGAAFRQARPI